MSVAHDQPKIDIAALEAVLDAVRDVPPEAFDMKVWHCGTVGCAIGWFCKKHPQDRLKLENFGPLVFPTLDDSSPDAEIFEDIAERFGVTEAEAEYLFGSESYSDMSRPFVLGRIEKFITKKRSAVASRARAAAETHEAFQEAVRKAPAAVLDKMLSDIDAIDIRCPECGKPHFVGDCTADPTYRERHFTLDPHAVRNGSADAGDVLQHARHVGHAVLDFRREQQPQLDRIMAEQDEEHGLMEIGERWDGQS